MVMNFQEDISVVKMKVKNCKREIRQLKQNATKELEAEIVSHKEILDQNNSLNRE